MLVRWVVFLLRLLLIILSVLFLVWVRCRSALCLWVQKSRNVLCCRCNQATLARAFFSARSAICCILVRVTFFPVAGEISSAAMSAKLVSCTSRRSMMSSSKGDNVLFTRATCSAILDNLIGLGLA